MGLRENRSSFRANVEVNPRLRKGLRDILELQVREMEEMTRTVDQDFRKNMKSQFATEGSSGGAKWAPLSPGYAKWKKKAYPGRKIMVRSGETRESLTSKSAPGHVARWTLKPRPVIYLGTDHRTPAYHVAGPLKNPNVPERDVLQHTPTQVSAYMERIKDVLRKKLERAARYIGTVRGLSRGRGVGGA